MSKIPVPEASSKPSGSWSQLLKDKVAFVTGGGGGIGSAIAHTSALHGARVVVADINKKTADEVVAKIISEDESQRDRVIAIELDVSDEQAVENAVKLVVDKWKTIDVLFNNAGIFAHGGVDVVPAETWTRLLNVNVLGCALMAKAIVPLFKKQLSGAIVQTASVSSFIAHPDFIAYSTTKGAVLQMTRNLALDLGPFNIRCNAICPGTIITPATTKLAADMNITMDQFAENFTPMQCIKRLGTTQEIANLAVFLASDLCHFITGAGFVADGGYTVT